MSDHPQWLPSLFSKQWDVFNCREQIILVDGSRWSGKTYSILHRIAKHLWMTPAAQYGIFAKSVKLAKDGGSWQMLIEHILPQWIDANLVGRDGKSRFAIVSKTAEGNPGPKVDANTRTAYCDVRNWYGGRSRVWLFSINNENEIEEKVKNKNFSGMYFVELSMWKERKLLPITINSLRMPGMEKYAENFIEWIADTNPDEVMGRNSWIYQVFYVERNKPPIPEETDDERAMMSELYKQMRVIHMHWRDNPHMTRQQQVRLFATCRGDRALKEAYYDGIWGVGGFETKFHFRHLFSPSKHLVGGNDGEEDQAQVAPTTTKLKSGWDIGGVNHAVILLDKWLRLVAGKEISCWTVLDEIVHIGTGMSHDECVKLDVFTEWVMQSILTIEKHAGKKFEWDHYADDSALNVFRPNSDNPYDYLEISKASGGTISLEGVHKPAHSRRTRVRMISILLQEERLFISAKCVKVRKMLENLSQSNNHYIVKSEDLHVFDALS